jgi:hypothetical protein
MQKRALAEPQVRLIGSLEPLSLVAVVASCRVVAVPLCRRDLRGQDVGPAPIKKVELTTDQGITSLVDQVVARCIDNETERRVYRVILAIVELLRRARVAPNHGNTGIFSKRPSRLERQSARVIRKIALSATRIRRAVSAVDCARKCIVHVASDADNSGRAIYRPKRTTFDPGGDTRLLSTRRRNVLDASPIASDP